MTRATDKILVEAINQSTLLETGAIGRIESLVGGTMSAERVRELSRRWIAWLPNDPAPT